MDVAEEDVKTEEDMVVDLVAIEEEVEQEEQLMLSWLT